MTERFHTIDGETLMSQPLAPIRFMVDDLLSQGLHLLAGAPKCGKSWLALWLSVTVAKGEETSMGSSLKKCVKSKSYENATPAPITTKADVKPGPPHAFLKLKDTC